MSSVWEAVDSEMVWNFVRVIRPLRARRKLRQFFYRDKTLADNEQQDLVLEWSKKAGCRSCGVYKTDSQHTVDMRHLHITRTRTITKLTINIETNRHKIVIIDDSRLRANYDTNPTRIYYVAISYRVCLEDSQNPTASIGRASTDWLVDLFRRSQLSLTFFFLVLGRT